MKKTNHPKKLQFADSKLSKRKTRSKDKQVRSQSPFDSLPISINTKNKSPKELGVF